MKHFLVISTVLCTLLSVAARAEFSDDQCPQGFAGKDRADIKNRLQDAGTQYKEVNSGQPIKASAWFDDTCQWDTQLDPLRPWKKKEYQSKVIDGVETQRVTLRGYLMSVKQDPDNDFHVEIGDSRAWESRHLIAEFPSLGFDCDARKSLADLVNRDADKYHVSVSGKNYALHKAVCVEVEGFVFLDMHHSRRDEADCQTSGGRGLRPPHEASKVVGLYEIHPAFSIKKVSSSMCNAG